MKIDKMIELLEKESVSIVDLEGEDLTALEPIMFKVFVSLLIQNRENICSIRMGGALLLLEQLELLFLSLINLPKVITLDLSNTLIDNSLLPAINEILAKTVSLQTLCLDACSLGDNATIMLCEGIQLNHTLKRLYLFKNGITDKAAKTLAQALRKNSTIIELLIGGNYLSNEGSKEIFTAIKENQTIEGTLQNAMKKMALESDDNTMRSTFTLKK